MEGALLDRKVTRFAGMKQRRKLLLLEIVKLGSKYQISECSNYDFSFP